MKRSMVAQDASTFVALGRAVSLAAEEGALDAEGSIDLAAALVAGLLTGCMEFDTYAQVHEALARLLEKAFETPIRPVPVAPGTEGAARSQEEPLGVYLEFVGEAWDKVSWDEEACGRLKTFVRNCFVLDRSRFGEGAWFRAPVKANLEDIVREAKAAGLNVISMEGSFVPGPAEAVLEDLDSQPSGARVVLGWGDRQTALHLAPSRA